MLVKKRAPDQIRCDPTFRIPFGLFRGDWTLEMSIGRVMKLPEFASEQSNSCLCSIVRGRDEFCGFWQNARMQSGDTLVNLRYARAMPNTSSHDSSHDSSHAQSVTVIVLDSVGMGELPDARSFSTSPEHPNGDLGSHTINHVLAGAGIALPNLESLGLGLIPTVHAARPAVVRGAYGRMREVSLGKDTSTGHWEFMGVQLEHPFKTFLDGFPAVVMDAFSSAIGFPGQRAWLCNKPYSGTDVIRDFGAEHLATGFPIVYTSGDSVFQIAAHLDRVPLETLYEWCRLARTILKDDFAVARVIARPFRDALEDVSTEDSSSKGEAAFERVNESRKDFSLEPPKNVLDALFAAKLEVIGLGKIPDIYANRGFTQSIHTDNNDDGVAKLLEVMRTGFHGLAFLNLVDFDAKFGHRRDVPGYAKALVDFDVQLPAILECVPEDGLLIITSDHGNDPTWFGSDHTREHGLLLAYRPGIGAINLGERESFADLGATVAQALGVTWNGPGSSFWQSL
jgi:phosphopentomutase